MSSTFLRSLPRALPRAAAAPTTALRLTPSARFASSKPTSDGKQARKELDATPVKAPVDGIKGKAEEVKEAPPLPGQVSFPDTTEVEINEDLRIPTEPDNYIHPKQQEEPPKPSETLPKVSLVTDASTHLAGGPSLSATGDDVQHGAAGDSIPQTGFAESEPLSADERRGLLVLGGIVLGGLGLSTLTKPRSKAYGREAGETH